MSGFPTSAGELVRLAIEREATAAASALSKLAQADGDDEVVHDLRVAVRRLRTFLRAARALYKRSPRRRVERALKAAGEATGALRDEEVLAETLMETAFSRAVHARVATWLAKRREGHAALRRDALASLSSARIEGTLSRVRALANAPRRDESAETFEAACLTTARLELVRLAVNASVEDVERLHALRIRFKRLRYIADMLDGDARSRDPAETERMPRSHEALVKLAASFQKELGVVHDIDVARLAVAAASDLHHATRASIDRALAARRLELATRCLVRLRSALGELVIPR